jgi:ribose/xylose/arabinose/galactoside ABC-type transport system permease subunit
MPPSAQPIAAVVTGGGSLSGGRGTVLGTLTLGAIIVIAVTVDQFRQRRWSGEGM